MDFFSFAYFLLKFGNLCLKFSIFRFLLLNGHLLGNHIVEISILRNRFLFFKLNERFQFALLISQPRKCGFGFFDPPMKSLSKTNVYTLSPINSNSCISQFPQISSASSILLIVGTNLSLMTHSPHEYFPQNPQNTLFLIHPNT